MKAKGLDAIREQLIAGKKLLGFNPSEGATGKDAVSNAMRRSQSAGNLGLVKSGAGGKMIWAPNFNLNAGSKNMNKNNDHIESNPLLQKMMGGATTFSSPDRADASGTHHSVSGFFGPKFENKLKVATMGRSFNEASAKMHKSLQEQAGLDPEA